MKKFLNVKISKRIIHFESYIVILHFDICTLH